MSTKKKLLEAAAGAAGGGVTYVDDVFSTFLYKGNGSTRNITNGIDLSGEGGLVWIKGRSSAVSHLLQDTERGATKILYSDNTVGEQTGSQSISAFNSDGWTMGNYSLNNQNNVDYASWTFRKQPGFFDVVTWSGDGTTNRQISHSLGSTPGMIIVKSRTGTDNWYTYHRSLGSGKFVKLNSADAAFTDTPGDMWGNTDPTDSVFTVGNPGYLNYSGWDYVAYVFAHDAQDFGTDSDEAIIKCGTYTGNGSSTGPTIDLGFEPQWVLLKKTTGSAEGWIMHDNMRGIASGEKDPQLQSNASSAEWSGYTAIDLTATGFNITSTSAQYNENGQTYIYMAIRRPHKPASELTATDLFKPSIYTGNGGGGNPAIDAPTSPQAIDLAFFKSRQLNGRNWEVITRLLTNQYKMENKGNPPQGLHFNNSDAESDVYSFGSTGRDIRVNQDGVSNLNVNGENYGAWRFSRAPGFFDVVAYTGSGSQSTVVKHNLGVVPEMVWRKRLDGTKSWYIWASALSGAGVAQARGNFYASSTSHGFPSGEYFPGDSQFQYNTPPTATEFTQGLLYQSPQKYITYLFASVAGLSKIGTYTGTGNDINVDCGFSSGARFVMVKRSDTSSTGDWYVWDTARGIVAGNDGYLRFNLANDEDSADWIDPLSSGFTITSSAPAAINASGGTYLFYAIA